MLSIKTAFTFFLLFFLSFFFLFINILDFLPSSRMLQLLDISSSSSGQARGDLFIYSLDLVSNNPFFGYYGGYTSLGGVGSYPHNLLSAWVNLGLLGFFSYIFLFIAFWKEAVIGFLKYRNNSEFKVFLVFLLYVTGALITSKDYSYMLVGFLAGFYVQYKKSLKGK